MLSPLIVSVSAEAALGGGEVDWGGTLVLARSLSRRFIRQLVSIQPCMAGDPLEGQERALVGETL